MQKAMDLLKSIGEEYAEILGENLVGIYIHGSLAFGCFNWEQSDVDFIVVVYEALPLAEKLALLSVLNELRSSAPPKGFEMSIVRLGVCKRFVYPTPYELHFSNTYLADYLNNPLDLCGDGLKTDQDLAAHFSVIRAAGVTLRGKPAPVAPAYYLNSILSDIKDAIIEVRKNSVSTVLNLCRVLAYVREGLVLSKEQGGQWAMLHLPEEYKPLLLALVNQYRQNIPHKMGDELLMEFCGYTLGLLHDCYDF